jgi:hypothetical protein
MALDARSVRVLATQVGEDCRSPPQRRFSPAVRLLGNRLGDPHREHSFGTLGDAPGVRRGFNLTINSIVAGLRNTG